MKTYSVINYYTNEYYGSIEADSLLLLHDNLILLMDGFEYFNFCYKIVSDNISRIIYLKEIN